MQDTYQDLQNPQTPSTIRHNGFPHNRHAGAHSPVHVLSVCVQVQRNETADTAEKSRHDNIRTPSHFSQSSTVSIKVTYVLIGVQILCNEGFPSPRVRESCHERF